MPFHLNAKSPRDMKGTYYSIKYSLCHHCFDRINLEEGILLLFPSIIRVLRSNPNLVFQELIFLYLMKSSNLQKNLHH